MANRTVGNAKVESRRSHAVVDLLHLHLSCRLIFSGG